MKTQVYIGDTETTGVDAAEDCVIQDAYLLLDRKWEVTAQVSANYKVVKPMKLGALAVHHIKPEEHDLEAPWADHHFPQDCGYLIGHNIDFDWKMMGQPDVKRICTLAMCRSIYPNLDAHNLSAMMYHHFYEDCPAILKEAHNALADCYNNHMLLRALLVKIGGLQWTPEQLWEYSEAARIPKIMPFGKYKGQPIRNVDRGWISWYQRQPDTDPYLMKALRGGY